MNHPLLPIWRVNSGTYLGTVIRELRRERSWTQDELADRANVARMTISRLERGEDVSVITTLRCISELGYICVIAPKASKVEAKEPWDGH